MSDRYGNLREFSALRPRIRSRSIDMYSDSDRRKSRRLNQVEPKVCPITLTEVVYPDAFTLEADGETYHKDAILEYYERRKRLTEEDEQGISSPVNRMPFTMGDITRLENLITIRERQRPRTPPTPRVNRGRNATRGRRGRGRGRRGGTRR